LIQEPKVALDEYTRRLTVKKRARSSFEAIIAQKGTETKHLEREKERLIDLYQAGSVSLKEIEARIAKIRTKMQKISGEQNLLRRELEEEKGQMKLIEQFEAFGSKLACRLDELTFDERKEIVRLLVTEVVVDTKKDEILIRHVIPGDKVCQLRSRGNLASPCKHIPAPCDRYMVR
jgi:polyribonucleotide nucleotidyltransferase